MKNRYLVSFLILVATIVVDQYTKLWAFNHLPIHYNLGFIMGLYSGLPDALRVVTLSCFAGVIFFLYIFLMYIIPARAYLLKYGLSFLVGGMFGNVIDKIVIGQTIDFIPFHYFGIQTVFNAADIFLWFGSGIVLFILLGKDKLIWHPGSSRGNYIVLPKEQYKVGLSFTLMVFCSSLIMGIFSYTFFTTTTTPQIIEKTHLMLIFFLTYISITALICFLAFVAGIIISHKSAGPIYAFELYINDLIKGNDRKLRLRDGDSYHHLEQVGDRLREHLNKPK